MQGLGGNLFERFGKIFTPNQIIFCEHEPGNDLYLIQSGRVKLTKVVEDKEKTIDILEDGDIFGEMAILEEAPRSANAIADNEVRVLSFNKMNFEILLKGQPQLALKILKVLSKRIYEAKRRLQILNLPSIEAKVIDTMLMLAETKGITNENDEEVELNTNDEQIASWCAIKLEEARKVLNKYHNLDKLNILPNKIILKNSSELFRFIYNKRKLQLEDEH